MEIITLIPIAIIFSYGAIQFFELTAALARISGIKTDAIVLGYSIQQSVYMITRFFMIALLPLLGFVVDKGIEKFEFEITSHLSLLLATIFGAVSWYFSSHIIAYYCGVIKKYQDGGNFISAFLNPVQHAIVFERPKLSSIIRDQDSRNTLIQSSLVYLIYSTGIFISFYLALIFNEYRASISQMSGVVNSFGAVLLTFVVEPRISKAIDAKSERSTELVFALFWGRIFATAVSGQLLLAIIFAST